MWHDRYDLARYDLALMTDGHWDGWVFLRQRSGGSARSSGASDPATWPGPLPRRENEAMRVLPERLPRGGPDEPEYDRRCRALGEP